MCRSGPWSHIWGPTEGDGEESKQTFRIARKIATIRLKHRGSSGESRFLVRARISSISEHPHALPPLFSPPFYSRFELVFS